MSVPETSRGLLTSSVVHVPLDDDRAGGGAASGEDQVGDLSAARRARCADLDDDLGVGVVEELATGSGNDRPSLTDNLGAGGDLEGAGDEVGTGINEDDLAARVLKGNV